MSSASPARTSRGPWHAPSRATPATARSAGGDASTTPRSRRRARGDPRGRSSPSCSAGPTSGTTASTPATALGQHHDPQRRRPTHLDRRDRRPRRGVPPGLATRQASACSRPDLGGVGTRFGRPGRCWGRHSRVPKTSFTAAARAFAPSITTSNPSWADRRRLTRSASNAFTTVLFSVAPSHSPTGNFCPSAVIVALCARTGPGQAEPAGRPANHPNRP